MLKRFIKSDYLGSAGLLQRALSATLAFFLLGCFLGAVFPTSTVLAANGGNRIYTVDIQKVLETSIVGKAARNDIEAEVKKRQAKLDTERTKFQRLQKDTQKQIALLSPDAAEEKRELLIKKEKELVRLAQDMKQEVDTVKDRKLGRIVEEIDEVIEDLSDDRDYPLVMEKDPRVILYVNKDFDITEDVIKELNRKKLDL